MKVTQVESTILRSHEEVAQVLRYAVPGARVDIRRPQLRHWAQKNTERSRCYFVSVRPHGRAEACVDGAYSLGTMTAESLAKMVRNQVEEKLREQR